MKLQLDPQAPWHRTWGRIVNEKEKYVGMFVDKEMAEKFIKFYNENNNDETINKQNNAEIVRQGSIS